MNRCALRRGSSLACGRRDASSPIRKARRRGAPPEQNAAFPVKHCAPAPPRLGPHVEYVRIWNNWFRVKPLRTHWVADLRTCVAPL